MPQQEKQKLGQEWIRTKVIGQDLCTGCGACVNLCPYQKIHRDHTINLHTCDRTDGRCRAYCPRSPVELDRLRRAMFDQADIIPELGPVKELYMTRASDKDTRSTAQHGGTVSALIKLALEENFIDTALLSDHRDTRPPQSHPVNAPDDVTAKAGSTFAVSPTLARFNEVSKGPANNIGVVATPCQALALAKMRVNPWPGDVERMQKLSLVVGLFCGWALNWQKLEALLDENAGTSRVNGMDIPPSGHACMEIYTNDGTIEVPIDKVNQCVRQACNYCFDMTCEFSDLAVGSARSPDGWTVDQGWNQVIVRSKTGQALLDLAKQKRVLEFKDVPRGNIEKLKNASARKKHACLGNLAARTGTENDLIYLDCEDAAVCRIQ